MDMMIILSILSKARRDTKRYDLCFVRIYEFGDNRLTVGSG